MLDLKQALATAQDLIGAFVESGSSIMVEMLGYAGLDFVVIDCEHGPLSPYGAELENVIRAAWVANVSPLVRVTWNDPRADPQGRGHGRERGRRPARERGRGGGRRGLGGELPPEGPAERGAADPRLARGFEGWGAYYERSLEDTLVFPLIEERDGVATIEEIAAVPGLGGIFFGPFDLAVSWGAGLGLRLGRPDGAGPRLRGGAGQRPADRRPRLERAIGPREDQARRSADRARHGRHAARQRAQESARRDQRDEERPRGVPQPVG